ncbi:hypothetical protein SAMN04487995_2916 [Dyadobacter koreensis]|uniref:Zinc-ribbon domain-containing protein n=1 Tax=Dyadobacter koreensis TaxID=408657 RepID=A0A1H6V3Q2_9BACT|nr:putative zinc-binding metallopeptidase [Dyadobacter koreensis]SEI99198.1 hypothetical protein SAMN04487995_2916 [Dyadobacter koreensis]
MKLFKCSNCGQAVYFENIYCQYCHSSLGFETHELSLYALKPENNRTYKLISGSGNQNSYKYCQNHSYNVCNWLVQVGSYSPFCKACELNRTIPFLGQKDDYDKWYRVETAKRRLIHSLLRFGLEVKSKNTGWFGGIMFDFLSDRNTSDGQRVLTGHDNGLITINIAEADDIYREMSRNQMNEVYRTLLGHFRHEIGHYYWDILIGRTSKLHQFRDLFGDERVDYGVALQQYYSNNTSKIWKKQYISKYASAHPWEDWAETWAHYMHIVDTLETADSFGLNVHPKVAADAMNTSFVDPYTVSNFDNIIDMWLPLTFAMNSLNRSMGLRDLYPFVISKTIKEKLRFIHEVVKEAGAFKAQGEQMLKS